MPPMVVLLVVISDSVGWVLRNGLCRFVVWLVVG